MAVGQTYNIKICGQKHMSVDLFMILRLDSVGYPTDPHPIVTRETIADDPKAEWLHFRHSILDHAGTPHCDFDVHHWRKGKGLGDNCRSELFYHNAVIIDLSDSKDAVAHSNDAPDVKYVREIRPEHFTKESIAMMAEKQAVIIRTGFDKVIEANIKAGLEELPYITEEAAKMIAGLKNIRVVGIDSRTVDYYKTKVSHPAFRGLLILESCVGLWGIPKDKHNDFTLATPYIGVEGATGTQVVAHAIYRD